MKLKYHLKWPGGGLKKVTLQRTHLDPLTKLNFQGHTLHCELVNSKLFLLARLFGNFLPQNSFCSFEKYTTVSTVTMAGWAKKYTAQPSMISLSVSCNIHQVAVRSTTALHHDHDDKVEQAYCLVVQLRGWEKAEDIS